MKGYEIEGGIHESLRLFAICDAMQWSHLPVAGALYDQHPKLLEDWMHIFSVRAEEDARKNGQATQKAEALRAQAKG